MWHEMIMPRCQTGESRVSQLRSACPVRSVDATWRERALNRPIARMFNVDSLTFMRGANPRPHLKKSLGVYHGKQMRSMWRDHPGRAASLL